MALRAVVREVSNQARPPIARWLQELRWRVSISGVLSLWRLRSVFREMSSETFWLLCWSVGGLIVMSLIPSKRVDRIFPMIPPLCLLLAAQIASYNSCRHGPVSRSSRLRVSNEELGIIALAFAILFTGGYTGWKVITGYRDHRDALAVFGRNIRHKAEVRHWRYEVVSAKDEGLLLYLRKTHFIESQSALAEWNGGNLNALIASTEKAPGLLTQLRDASLSELKSSKRKKEQGTNYVLITR